MPPDATVSTHNYHLKSLQKHWRLSRHPSLLNKPTAQKAILFVQYLH